MSALLDCITAATRPLLWLDDADYSERLLAGGQTPWLDSTEYIAFRRKAQGLLKADLWAVPLGRFFDAWVDASPGLRTEMAAKKRAVVPVRTLLADEPLRAHLRETIKGLGAAFANTPLVLAMPSPRVLLKQAWRMAFDADPDVEMGGDEVDSCAVYVAEFLRSFGACDVDALLLEETPGDEPADAEALGWYQPVCNIAEHYRWDLGLSLPDADGGLATLAPMQFVITPRAIDGVIRVGTLPATFWSGTAPDVAPTDKLWFSTVPADAVPEQVLARLAVLRNG